MVPLAMIQLLTPAPAIVAGVGGVGAIVTSLLRANRFDRATRLLLLIGASLFALAAGSPVWVRGGADRVTVMVDLSPSTRGADYCNRAQLNARIAQLMGDTPVDLVAFAGLNGPLPAGETLADVATDRTQFSPPPGQPVLLFSDGQFDLPAVSPPVYAVLDPQLLEPDDSRVASLRVEPQVAVASVEHHGPPRRATWSGAKFDSSVRVDAPEILSAETADGEIRLSLNGGDRWPENDTLSSLPAPKNTASRWWIGRRNPGAGWKHLQASQCPADPAAWLEPSVVVLDDVSADDLDRLQQEALLRYAHDVGGSVIVLGGSHAFAAGQYGSTPIGVISPLADAPPSPQSRWIILIDASGSMAAPGPAGSLFDAECAAARALLPLLPPADLVQVGAFSGTTQVWINSSAAAAMDQKLPPPGATPNGPTALEPALRGALSPSAMPTRVLLMTDADTDPLDAASLSSAASTAHAKLLVLALGHGKALPSLREIAAAAHGNVIEQPDALQWASAASDLLKSQLPDRIETSPVQFTFTGDLRSLGTRNVDQWNHSWLKQGGELLAGAGDTPIVARWRVGSGSAVGAAYAMPIADVNAIADVVARPPIDPRFSVRWDTSAASPKATVSAVDRGQFLNRQQLRLVSVDPQSSTLPEETAMDQVAPGRYEAALPPASHTRLVRIMLGARSLDRRAVAGRYPAEFDRIGTDLANLKTLADRTGGAVVPVGQVAPLRLHASRVQWSLVGPLVGAGLLFISGGLLRWKRGR